MVRNKQIFMTQEFKYYIFFSFNLPRTETWMKLLKPETSEHWNELRDRHGTPSVASEASKFQHLSCGNMRKTSPPPNKETEKYWVSPIGMKRWGCDSRPLVARKQPLILIAKLLVMMLESREGQRKTKRPDAH